MNCPTCQASFSLQCHPEQWIDQGKGIIKSDSKVLLIPDRGYKDQLQEKLFDYWRQKAGEGKNPPVFSPETEVLLLEEEVYKFSIQVINSEGASLYWEGSFRLKGLAIDLISAQEVYSARTT